VGVAALLVLAGPVGQADAVVTGLARVTPFTSSTSVAKSVTATCPAGTRVIGPGGDTTPGNGSVVLNQIRPDASLTSVTLHANEDEVGTPSNWFLQAFVICAAPPPGLELVSATSASTSANKSVVATCPSGKRLLGNGAEITGAAGQVLLDGQLPNAQLTSVTANAVEDETGTAAAWSITAYAICGSAVTGCASARAVDCPAGKLVTGAGIDIAGGTRQGRSLRRHPGPLGSVLRVRGRAHRFGPDRRLVEHQRTGDLCDRVPEPGAHERRERKRLRDGEVGDGDVPGRPARARRRRRDQRRRSHPGAVEPHAGDRPPEQNVD
jgi:hypothetical protein